MQAEKDKLEGLPADSEEHKSLKDQLRSVVCNSEELKVCCEAQRDESDEPAFLPSLEKEQCGLGLGTAGFIRQSPTPRHFQEIYAAMRIKTHLVTVIVP